ncbi:EutN/CcmL family microcompartment protein [bacterium]|nr:EutN/CcmL family microcompartment protein [candidate division CSSED10-310 bacterium]
MFAGRVVGRVVATRKDPGLVGAKLLVVECTDWHGNVEGQPVIALDTIGSGAGEFVFYVKSREAAVAYPGIPPVDAAIVGIIDQVDLEDD